MWSRPGEENPTEGDFGAEIKAALPVGKANAISRSALALRLGLTDRQMRRALERARGDGLIVINDCDGRGYYLPEG